MIKHEIPESIQLNGEITKPNKVELSDEGHRIITIRCCDETVVERSFGKIQLSHSPEHIDLTKFRTGSLFIRDHDVSKIENCLGVITNSYLQDSALYVEVKLSNRTEVQGIIGDILDGILTGVSVGTNITEVLSEVEVDGEIIYRLAHQPYEISSVINPAISTAKVILNDKEAQDLINVLEAQDLIGDRLIEKSINIPVNNLNLNKEETQMSEQDKVNLSDERARVAAIMSLSATHKIDPTKALAEGTAVGEFQGQVLKSLESKPVVVETPAKVGLTDKEAKKFSILKALQASASGNWAGAEFEREATIASANLAGKPVSANSFVIPGEVQFATVANNPAMVETERLGFIEALYSQTLLNKLGVTALHGLTGDVDIPRQTGSTSVTWVGENGDATPSDITTDLVTLSPKTASAIVPISHKMMMQTSQSVEAMIRADLTKQVALAVDEAILFTGTGTTSPLALIGQAGVGAIDATAGLEWAMIVDAYKTLAVNDITGALSWLSSPTVVAKLQGILRSSADTASNFIMNSHNDNLNGFGVNKSNIVPADKLVLGDYSQLVVGTWGAVELAVDPYTNFANGGIQVRAMTSVDSAVKHPEAFTVISNIA